MKRRYAVKKGHLKALIRDFGITHPRQRDEYHHDMMHNIEADVQRLMEEIFNGKRRRAKSHVIKKGYVRMWLKDHGVTDPDWQDGYYHDMMNNIEADAQLLMEEIFEER